MTAAPSPAAAERPSTFRSLRHRNARIFFSGLLVSTIGTWLQITAMSLLVYDLTGRATDLGITVALQFLPMLCSAPGPEPSPIGGTSARWRWSLQSGLALQALLLGVARPRRPGHGARRVGAHAGDGCAQRLREPGATGPRHRARGAAGDQQRRRAEHGRDDRVADLRAGAGRGARRDRRHGVVLPAQRRVVRGRARIAAACCAPRSCTPRRWRRAAGARSGRRWRSSAAAATCSSRSS